jgi:hypothetical protein
MRDNGSVGFVTPVVGSSALFPIVQKIIIHTFIHANLSLNLHEAGVKQLICSYVFRPKPSIQVCSFLKKNQKHWLCEASNRWTCFVLFKKRTKNLSSARRQIVGLVLFFLKKEPKTLALRGFNSLNLLLFFKELTSTGSARLKNVDPYGI